MRTGSRKSPARALVLVLLLLSAATAGAQLQHRTTVIPADNHLDISIAVAGADVDGLFDTLNQGMRARIEFRIRVAAPRERPFRLLGERPLAELRPAFDARWDPFLSRYVVERSGDAAAGDDAGAVGGAPAVEGYADEATLYAAFFTLQHYRVPWDTLSGEGSIIVETSVRYTPIVFVPGLSILSLFTHNRSRNSPWVRHTVERPQAEP